MVLVMGSATDSAPAPSFEIHTAELRSRKLGGARLLNPSDRRVILIVSILISYCCFLLGRGGQSILME